MAVELFLKRANERSFLGVDSKMVIEIVPLSEIERTAWMIALQNFEVAVCFRILELENSE